MEPILRLNEFFVEGGEQERSHVLLHITEPSTPEEKKRGYFFAICETNNAASDFILRLQSIIDEVENDFYETHEEIGKSILEKILEKINQQSVSLLNNDAEFHCVIGALNPPHITFTFYNNPLILLFYKKQDGSYQKMDLVAANQEENLANKKHIFSQIIEGKITPNDFFFVGTPKIAEYFSHDRLQKVISSRPGRQSAEHLERVLHELRNGLSFGGLIVQLEKNSDSIPATAKASDLGPEKTEPAPRLTNRIRPHLSQKTEKIITTENIRQFLSIVWAGLKYLGQAGWWLILLLVAILKNIGQLLVSLFFIITNIQNRRRNVLDSLKRTWYNYKQNYKQLPTITKILILASFITILILVFGLSFVKARRAEQTAVKNYQTKIELIAAKKDAAESSMIYNDNITALNELSIAKATLQNLACDRKEQKITCQNLTEELDELLAKIQKIYYVQPQLITDWSQNGNKPNLTGLVRLNNKIMAFSPNNSNIFTYDFLTKETKIAATGFSNPNLINASVPKENDYVAFLSNKKEIYQFNPEEGGFKKADIDYPNSAVEITNLVVYNRRLYTLDSLNNQIYKHDSIKTGYGPGKVWLKDSVDLKNSTGLTVEGDLFIVKQNGEILKFNAGIKQPFEIQGLDPALTSANQIWSYNDLNYIYILDSIGKRLVVLNKDGKLKNQVSAKEFVKPTGIIVDEINKTAYVLDDDKLYQIALP